MTVSQNTRLPVPSDPASQRRQHIDSLRSLADLLEQHPELEPPHTGTSHRTPLYVIVPTRRNPQFSAWALTLTEAVDTIVRGRRLVTGRVGDLHVEVISYAFPPKAVA